MEVRNLGEHLGGKENATPAFPRNVAFLFGAGNRVRTGDIQLGKKTAALTLSLSTRNSVAQCSEQTPERSRFARKTLADSWRSIPLPRGAA